MKLLDAEPSYYLDGRLSVNGKTTSVYNRPPKTCRASQKLTEELT